jgi:hypothetical protein
MKKLLLLSFFLLSFYCKAQTSVYHPFPDSNAFWCSQTYGYDGTCDYHYYYSCYFGNDTIINSNIYHILRCTGFNMSSLCTSGYSYSGCLIRQDTALRKLFRYDSSTNTDTILYDFNLNLGDTLDESKIFWGNLSGIHIVTSIDSILINGQYRKRFNHNASQGCSDSSIIEGIGSTSGVLSYPSACFENYSELTSFEQNGVGMYPNSSANCNVIPGIIDLIKEIYLEISPNPAHDVLNVECNLSNAELKIYDMTGRMVLEEKLHSQLSTFNFQLSSGVYFVRVSDGEKEAAQKLIVE